MHPAMFLRDTQAQFTDPASGERIRPGSRPHQLSDFVMAALRVGFAIRNLREEAPDPALAERFPRAAKYVGWPMLVAMVLGV
jgi:malonyl-CoA O-methyltransferase